MISNAVYRSLETELEYKDKIKELIQNIDALYPDEQAPRIRSSENLFFCRYEKENFHRGYLC